MRPKEVTGVSEVELVIEGGGGKISCGGAEKHGENSGGSDITHSQQEEDKVGG